MEEVVAVFFPSFICQEVVIFRWNWYRYNGTVFSALSLVIWGKIFLPTACVALEYMFWILSSSRAADIYSFNGSFSDFVQMQQKRKQMLPSLLRIPEFHQK